MPTAQLHPYHRRLLVWVFRYKADLTRASILSTKLAHTLAMIVHRRPILKTLAIAIRNLTHMHPFTFKTHLTLHRALLTQ
ncbi:hypothetical protein A0H81_02682 [Grifola frondosa]|uniref:Uncharacterized protein n=1 Tax=Grifola frondosa TaxID=5627 RepID=A0A1C7MM86_GRIFR|nr:hypothetical protein A0H81_02682 [Grifola frondosa]